MYGILTEADAVFIVGGEVEYNTYGVHMRSEICFDEPLIVSYSDLDDMYWRTVMQLVWGEGMDFDPFHQNWYGYSMN